MLVTLCGAIIKPRQAIAQSTGDAGQTITYDQILSNPDDLELNFRYARQEAARGNLAGASTALERILLLEPEWNTARLFYAVVLFRLDDLLAAERELKILSGRKLTQQQATEVERYTKLIERRRENFFATGFLGAGTRYDSNRNFATNLNDPVLALGLPATSTVAPEDDYSYRGFAGVNGRYRLSQIARDEIYFRLTGIYNEQDEVDDQSFSDFYAEVGLDYDARFLTIEPHLIGRSFAINDDHYFLEAGGGIAFEGSINPRFKWRLSGDGLYQEFESIDVAASGELRTGFRYQFGVMMDYAFNARSRFAGGLFYDDKTADFDAFSYEGARIELEYLYLFGRGSFMKLQGSASAAEFDAPDPLISPNEIRQDRRYVTRLTVGVPLNSIGGWFGLELPKSFSDLMLQSAIDHRRQDSNIGNYSYDNTGAETSLIWRF